MYFKDRREAGQKLAAEMLAYRYENTAVLALSPGGVEVAEPIAQALHTTLAMMLTAPIELADYGTQTIGIMDQAGTFTYDRMIPAGLLEEIEAEMHNVLEAAKLTQYHAINKLLGEHGLIDRQQFYGRNVVIVNDGLKNGLAFEAAVNFLKPIKTAKLIGAVPVTSVAAVDRLHILCDELHVLNVAAEFVDTNHYYDQNAIGDPNTVIEKINQVVTKWR